MTEVWVPVPEFPNYQVSSCGRVRRAGGEPLSLTLDVRGYPKVTLYSPAGRMKAVRVHTIVALAFYGPPHEGQLVRHLDDVRTNNHLRNLQYGTYLENREDRERNEKRRKKEERKSRRGRKSQGKLSALSGTTAVTGGGSCKVS